MVAGAAAALLLSGTREADRAESAGMTGSGTTRGDRLDQIERSLARLEQKLDRVDVKLPKGTPIDVVLGAQWGDEGKGKLVDILSAEYDICARVAGGSNAGHTIVVGDKIYKFHLIPSGILNSKTKCVVGNGVVVHVPSMLKELQSLKDAGVDYRGRVILSDRAHMVFDFHQTVDGLNEDKLARHKKGNMSLGTTKKGIGPAYGSKIMRNGVRLGDLRDFDYFEERLRNLVTQLQASHPDLEVDIEAELAYYRQVRKEVVLMTTDTIEYINQALLENKKVLVEGANATMLDIDFGTYPYVTSSNPSIGSVCTGLGVAPNRIGEVITIVQR